MRLSRTMVQKLIPKTTGEYSNHQETYDTDDIIDLMTKVDTRDIDKTKKLAKRIPATRAGMKMIYDFLLHEIKYQRDPKKSQWVRSPSRFIHVMKGDCKSYTHFTTRVLRNLGLRYELNFTSYKKSVKKPYHVYPTAILPDGTRVHIDAVWGRDDDGRFGAEKPFEHKIKYKVKNPQGLAYLSGTDDESIIETLVELDKIIPDAVMDGEDVTEMTEGELQRFQLSNRLEVAAYQTSAPRKRQQLLDVMRTLETDEVAYLGNVDSDIADPVFKFMYNTKYLTSRAMVPPRLRFSSSEDIDDISGLISILKKGAKKIKKGVSKAGKGAVKVVKVVGSAFKTMWKKVMNFLFKKVLPGAGPFFLFTFIKKKGVNNAVNARRAKQVKTLDWIQKVGGLKRSNINTALQSGIVNKLGADPKTILNEKANDQIAGDSKKEWIMIATQSMGFLIKGIEALSKLFKKKSPKVSLKDASDPVLLEDLVVNEDSKDTIDQYDDDKPSEGVSPVMIALGLGAAFIAFK